MIYDRIEVDAAPVSEDFPIVAEPGELLPDSGLIIKIGEVGKEENSPSLPSPDPVRYGSRCFHISNFVTKVIQLCDICERIRRIMELVLASLPLLGARLFNVVK